MAETVETLTPEAITEDSLPNLGDTELQQAIESGTNKEEESPVKMPEVKQQKEPEKKIEQKEPVKETPTDLDSLREEVSKLNKRLQDKETFIQRQGTEIGELRKARQFYEDQIKLAQQQFQEQMQAGDPAQAMNAYEYIQQAKQNISTIDINEFVQTNAAYIHQLYPEYDLMIDDVAKYGESIGVPKDQIENFKRNPYSTDVRTLIPYVEGAKRMKDYSQKDSLLETLKKQVMDLDSETSEETVVNKIAAASKKTPVITSRVSDGNTRKTTDGLNEKNIHSLSDADLETMLKEAKG